jgi:hypothetical protein
VLAAPPEWREKVVTKEAKEVKAVKAKVQKGLGEGSKKRKGAAAASSSSSSNSPYSSIPEPVLSVRGNPSAARKRPSTPPPLGSPSSVYAVDSSSSRNSRSSSRSSRSGVEAESAAGVHTVSAGAGVSVRVSVRAASSKNNRNNSGAVLYDSLTEQAGVTSALASVRKSQKVGGGRVRGREKR